MLTASESGSTNDMFCLRYISKIYNADIPSQSTSMNSCRSQTIFVQSFCFTASYREIPTILPVFPEPQGSPGAAFRYPR